MSNLETRLQAIERASKAATTPGKLTWKELIKLDHPNIPGWAEFVKERTEDQLDPAHVEEARAGYRKQYQDTT